MKHRWWWWFSCTACLTTAIAASDDAVAAASEANLPEVGVTGALIDSREASRVFSSGGNDEDAVTETTMACSSTGSYSTTDTEAVATNESTGNTICETNSSSTKSDVDRLRERVARINAELIRALTAYMRGQQRERKLALVERVKYGYVNVASEKVLKLVDNVQHVEIALAANAMRERRIQEKLSCTHRTMNRLGRRLQVIRRLLAGAEVAMVHMESNRKLSSSDTNPKKR